LKVLGRRFVLTPNLRHSTADLTAEDDRTDLGRMEYVEQLEHQR